MGPKSAGELLRVWEQAAAAPPVLRGAALVSACEPETFPDARDLPLGELTRQLLALRAARYGDEVTSVTDCPRCAQIVELRFRISGLDPSPPPPGPVRAEARDLLLELHPPTSRDLWECAIHGGDAAECRRSLFDRCLVSLRERDTGRTVTKPWDEELERAADRALSEADPHADLELAVRCPQCGHGWEAPFDPGSYLFFEVAAEARRLLRDVHELAAAYGWEEGGILAMSPARRAAYLELVRG